MAKDDRGQLYSRRLQIDDDVDEFIETNLKTIRDANIAGFRSRLQEVADVDGTVVSRCIVYGELICNRFYDYVERDMIGDWRVFGAAVLVKQDPTETLEKFLKAGFAAAIKSSNKHLIQLFMNEKFVEVAKNVKLDVPEQRGINESISKIIETNKDAMKKGLLEGLVFTINDNGYKVMKWKGAQEYQPVAVEKLIIANDKIQKKDVKEELKTTFGSIYEVTTDISQNKNALKLAKKKKQKPEKEGTNPKGKGKKYLSNLDKEIIQHGILHSQKKFDTLEEYAKKGEVEEYKNILVTEVKKHYAEEKGETEELDDTFVTFINHKVNAVIKGQMASLQKDKTEDEDYVSDFPI